jgi:hypothetical protein
MVLQQGVKRGANEPAQRSQHLGGGAFERQYKHSESVTVL